MHAAAAAALFLRPQRWWWRLFLFFFSCPTFFNVRFVWLFLLFFVVVIFHSSIIWVYNVSLPHPSRSDVTQFRSLVVVNIRWPKFCETRVHKPMDNHTHCTLPIYRTLFAFHMDVQLYTSHTNPNRNDITKRLQLEWINEFLSSGEYAIVVIRFIFLFFFATGKK